MIDKAIRRLNQEGVELVLHTGDYVSGFTIPRFKALNARLIGVFGNNDGDRQKLKEKFGENGKLEIRGSFAELTVGGLKAALLHGSEEELVKALIEGQSFDVVVRGHLHRTEAYRKGKTLVINPGEVCGYLSGRSTIALLDTAKNEAKTVELPF
jgi:putative phosphoesterase